MASARKWRCCAAPESTLRLYRRRPPRKLRRARLRNRLTPLRTLRDRAAQGQNSIATQAGLLGRSGCSGLRVSAAEFFVEQDRFGDFFHGHAPLPAFALQG